MALDYIDIDFDYYSLEFSGTSMTLEDFENIYSRCKDMIMFLIPHNSSFQNNISDLHSDYFKKALAYQVEFIYKNGGNEFLSTIDDFALASVSSVSLGSFKYTLDKTSSVSSFKESIYSKMALEYIGIILDNSKGLRRASLYD